MCLCGLRFQKTHYFPHTVHYCCSSIAFLKCADFYKAHRLRSEVCSDWPAIQYVVIGRIPQAWDGNVTPLTVLWCVSRRHDTKTIKLIINEAFVASSGDIITDYNDLYCLFTCRVASRRTKNIILVCCVLTLTDNQSEKATKACWLNNLQKRHHGFKRGLSDIYRCWSYNLEYHQKVDLFH